MTYHPLNNDINCYSVGINGILFEFRIQAAVHHEYI